MYLHVTDIHCINKLYRIPCSILVDTQLSMSKSSFLSLLLTLCAVHLLCLVYCVFPSGASVVVSILHIN